MSRGQAANQATIESVPDEAQSPAPEQAGEQAGQRENVAGETSQQDDGADGASPTPPTQSNADMITEAAAKLDIT
jgi:hypothetical protein